MVSMSDNTPYCPLETFDFHLPESLIAQHPVSPRDHARMLVVKEGGVSDFHVYDLPELLNPGDVMVFNDTRVIPARLKGKRIRNDARGGKTEAAIEFLLHLRLSPCRWQCFAKPAKRLKPHDQIFFSEDFHATVEAIDEEGQITLHFAGDEAFFWQKLEHSGELPLPPYIARKQGNLESDRKNYQTVYANKQGAVAAPTAGLHFTPELLEALKTKGIHLAFVTLHVGAGTFLPVKVDNIHEHKMHKEYGEISPETANLINQVKEKGGKLVAVGTTSLRLLESAVDASGKIHPFAAETGIFITPGFQFRAADVLMTNFHLPKSTLFMLVSAFSGLETMRGAYQHAIDSGYRFYSYGDSSLLYLRREHS
jgi:S-adenosylmethionine:tRNA ribosyltransferase-isomerase